PRDGAAGLLESERNHGSNLHALSQPRRTARLAPGRAGRNADRPRGWTSAFLPVLRRGGAPARPPERLGGGVAAPVAAGGRAGTVGRGDDGRQPGHCRQLPGGAVSSTRSGPRTAVSVWAAARDPRL